MDFVSVSPLTNEVNPKSVIKPVGAEEPYATASIKLVVVAAEFNGNQYRFPNKEQQHQVHFARLHLEIR